MRGFECPNCKSNVLGIRYGSPIVASVVTEIDSPTSLSQTKPHIVSVGPPANYRCGGCGLIIEKTLAELYEMRQKDSTKPENRDWKSAYSSEAEAFKRFRIRVAETLRSACPIWADGVEVEDHHVKDDANDLIDVIKMLATESREQFARAIRAESKLTAIRDSLADVLDKGKDLIKDKGPQS